MDILVPVRTGAEMQNATDAIWSQEPRSWIMVEKIPSSLRQDSLAQVRTFSTSFTCQVCKDEGTSAFHVGQAADIHERLILHFCKTHTVRGLLPFEVKRQLIKAESDKNEFKGELCTHFTAEHDCGIECARFTVIETRSSHSRETELKVLTGAFDYKGHG